MSVFEIKEIKIGLHSLKIEYKLCFTVILFPEKASNILTMCVCVCGVVFGCVCVCACVAGIV